MSRLEGRAVLLTGGGTGIGRAAAIRLAQEGALVAVSGRREDKLAETVAELGDRGLAIPGDVSIDEDAKRMVAETVAAFGRLDVLVNNAGAIQRNVLLHELETERWDELIASNLRSVFLVTRAALRRKLESVGDRSIVNVASTFALAAGPGVSAYTAAKGGVISLTRALAIEYAPHGIRANCVCPGIVVTPFAYTDRPHFEEQREELARMYPLGRSASRRTLPARSPTTRPPTPAGWRAPCSRWTAASRRSRAASSSELVRSGPAARRPCRRGPRRIRVRLTILSR
jgi:NAD(P)-dependent dehydrogenase (short-subunit alcohol dehydrogenase family)